MLVQSLQKIGADFLILDQGALADQVKLRWQVTDHGVAGYLKVGEKTVDICEIHSVYHRFVNPEDVPGSSDSPPVVNKARSTLRSLMDLFDILPARVVNRRRPMMSNNSKPYQALLIRQAGFAIPETYITNEPRSLITFASLNGPLIYKSISSIRSIVTPLDEKSAIKIEALRCLPTQFQRKIEGFNVRVHVIGRRLFATQILTSATDYRYAIQEGASTEFRPYELNMELRKRCLHLARICQLPFAGIDLMVSPGKVYCLEVNPSPGYSYYQDATGQPISDALAEHLIYEQ
jgi:glutathione synthase/RimK-type ligase-like ATP-grasp enzyme